MGHKLAHMADLSGHKAMFNPQNGHFFTKCQFVKPSGASEGHFQTVWGCSIVHLGHIHDHLTGDLGDLHVFN
jgi:hypothetical protein